MYILVCPLSSCFCSCWRVSREATLLYCFVGVDFVGESPLYARNGLIRGTSGLAKRLADTEDCGNVKGVKSWDTGCDTVAEYAHLSDFLQVFIQ